MLGSSSIFFQSETVKRLEYQAILLSHLSTVLQIKRQKVQRTDFSQNLFFFNSLLYLIEKDINNIWANKYLWRTE